MAISWQKSIALLKEHGLLMKINGDVKNDFEAVTYDSRKVATDTLFFAKGNFKVAFLTDAIMNGARAYVAEREYIEGNTIPSLIVTDVQKAMALLAAEFYDNPQDKLFIIGFTGTKGKTTAAYFTHEILQIATANHTALFSTIDRILGPKEQFKSDLSTPESLDLFHDMHVAVKNKMTHLVMEVSSQAYKKNRVYNLKYDVGIFLNISPDHIGPLEHPTFADYLAHKLMLIDNSKKIIINNESECFADIYERAKRTHESKDIYIYGRDNSQNQQLLDLSFSGQADLNMSKLIVTAKNNKVKELAVSGQYRLNVPGDYNESNAASVLLATGLAKAPHQAMVNGLELVRVPGRMESFSSKKHGMIYVDYAHNYVSVKALLHFLHTQHPQGRVIIVLGAPGNKGESRRSGFGQAFTEEKADVVWLTADDPQYEDPQIIANEIAEATDLNVVTINYEMDRPQAIFKAISMSTATDVVAVLGKGLDPYQKINGVDTPYIGDMAVVKQVVKNLEK